MSAPRILFVDDEPTILVALGRVMRRMSKVWDMVFVNSGDEALRELDKGPFDVIVTDMRMPGIDGAELLARVAARWPSVKSLVLTGHADAEALERAAKYTRQVLSKPCEPEVLRSAIEDAMPIAA